MSDTERSLLNAVLENPDDDLPRLVYADWLDEYGDHKRADFIRTQITLCTAVESKEYTSDEYATATKQMLKFRSREFVKWFEAPTQYDSNKKCRYDTYDEVIKLYCDATYFIERGFPFCVQSSFEWIRKNISHINNFPIRRLRLNWSGTQEFIIKKEHNRWHVKLMDSLTMLAESDCDSRESCFRQLGEWSSQLRMENNSPTLSRADSEETEPVEDVHDHDIIDVSSDHIK